MYVGCGRLLSRDARYLSLSSDTACVHVFALDGSGALADGADDAENANEDDHDNGGASGDLTTATATATATSAPSVRAPPTDDAAAARAHDDNAVVSAAFDEAVAAEAARDALACGERAAASVAALAASMRLDARAGDANGAGDVDGGGGGGAPRVRHIDGAADETAHGGAHDTALVASAPAPTMERTYTDALVESASTAGTYLASLWSAARASLPSVALPSVALPTALPTVDVGALTAGAAQHARALLAAYAPASVAEWAQVRPPRVLVTALCVRVYMCFIVWWQVF